MRVELIFSTPVAFGFALESRRVENKKPNWVQVVSEVVILKTTTLVRILDELS